MGFGLTNGSGLRVFCLARRVMSASRRRITSFSLTPCCIGFVRAFPGGIYQDGLATRLMFISGSAIGPKLVCGSGSLPIWQLMPITNTR